ncbi:hypothetical protein Tco_1026873 [Tanacetum coccineum]
MRMARGGSLGTTNSSSQKESVERVENVIAKEGEVDDDERVENVIAKQGIRTDNQEKDEKQSQNDKTGLGMEKTVKDKAKSKPENQSSQKVNRKVNWSKSKSTQVNPGAKVKEI